MKDNETKEAIDFMLRKFKPERYAYLTVTFISFLILIYCVAMQLFQSGSHASEEDLAPVIGMVGAGGAISYTASQLLKMWRDCMVLISRSLEKKEEA